ncbi:hypothetical protein K488DRAFT_90553 [Vararia minispora EC-137]|uniref:Uncharacterized protein n=1 Tax=Vararia minispora EC-137 TaxID=1314806 RepID=A0ACB8Q7K6_9AGAM|nr:hypothetical protein K488DRAFT_90553 [Vararia minispora EC-137]
MISSTTLLVLDVCVTSVWRLEIRIIELVESLRDTFYPAIPVALYSRTQIGIQVHVLAHDGAFLPLSTIVSSFTPLESPPPSTCLKRRLTSTSRRAFVGLYKTQVHPFSI